MNERELELIVTDDLVEELARRFDVFVVGGIQAGVRGDEYHTLRHCTGNFHTCAGLAADLGQLALGHLRDAEQEHD
jgi:hypothetical protein